MRAIRAVFLSFAGGFAVFAPIFALAQEPTPATTQSQSGYPDIRKEAADPTLFPNPDDVARNLTRPVSAVGGNRRGETAGGSRGGRNRRSGSGRANDLMLGQADSDPLPIRISYRRAKTTAMERNPGLRTLLVEADSARTDVEKRQYLHAYYNQLFAAVGRIDSSPAMKSHLTVLSRVVEQRYDPKRRAVAGEEDLVTGRGEGRRGRLR